MPYMKYLGILSMVAIVCVLALPQMVSASTIVRTGDSVMVTADQTVDGAFYALGGSVALSGVIKGDALIAGGEITVNGQVTDDLLVLGGTVAMNASGTKDVRIVAGNVTISQPITGSLVVVGGRLTILSTASVSGDVLFYGEDATIDGAVGGQILGNVRNLRVNGKVAKGIDVTVRALTLGDRADVTGDVQYASQTELVRAPNAVVTGNVVQGAAATTVAEDSAAAFRQSAIVFLISLFATLSLYLLARRFVETVTAAATQSVALKFLVGFAALVLLPISIVILLASMLGILIGVLGVVTLLLLVVLAVTLMNAVCGALLARAVTKQTKLSVPYIIAGAVVVQICFFIPLVGSVLLTALFFTTAGTLVTLLYQSVTSRG